MPKSTAPLTPAMLDLIKYSGGGENVLKAGPTRAALIRRELVHPMDSNRAGKLTEAGMQVWAKANPAPVSETVDPLEAELPPLAEDRYFTHGCGADTLKRDALEAEWRRVDPEGCAALAESAAALPPRDAAAEAPRFDFAARAAAQVKRDALEREEIMHSMCTIDNHDGCITEGVYGPEQTLPQREPGKALVEELLGGEVDEAMGLPAGVTDTEVADVLRERAVEKLTPVSPLSVLLRPVRGELVDRATRETFIAVGDIWGVWEGYRFRIVCEDSSDMLHGRPLTFMWSGTEPQWALEGDGSRDTPWPLLEGTVVQINGWVSYQVQARPGYALPHLIRIN